MTTNNSQLREKRIKIYCETLNTGTCSIVSIHKILGIINPGKIPHPIQRDKNFTLFVEQNFSSLNHSFEAINPWPDSKTHIKAYKILHQYAQTTYGAVMIKRVLDDNNKPSIKRFTVRLDDNATVNANTHFISFPSNFPVKEIFPGGEKIDPLAVIHHEFGHTRFFTNNTSTALVSILNERKAVIENSNPVRMLNKNEPRYTYYNGKETINIITSVKKPGRWLYDLKDPRILVQSR